MPAIEVHQLVKTYGEVRAVDGISFAVDEGEVFGLLGPNGAGKTTTVEILEGYRRPDQGEVTVLGLDPFRDGRELRERVGILLQSTSLYPDLSVAELVGLFSGYYRNTLEPDTLLSAMGLEEKRSAHYGELSGGQRQRLALILAFLNEPQVLFLDEPTAGLDPQSRQAVWEWMTQARENSRTVFLTTHYIEEAEELADRIGVIDHGELIVVDDKAALMRRLGKRQLTLQMRAPLASLPSDLTDLDLELSTDGGSLTWTFDAQGEASGIAALLRRLAEHGIDFKDLNTAETSLEEIFVSLVRRRS